MAANTSPVFELVPVIGLAQISTANANLDGTGTVATVVTAGTDGTRIDFVTIKAIVTTTAGMIRFFIHDGSNYRLMHEEAVSAITKSATVAAFEATWKPSQSIVLPNAYSLRVSTEKAETFNILAHGGTLS